MKSLYEYLDYRKYLSDYYTYQKSASTGFSHRVFLEKAGMSGPNFLKNVIDGKRNLSEDGAKKFARALGLLQRETEYFCTLVLFNQAEGAEKKRETFSTLSAFLHKTDIQLLHKNQYAYFSNWYNVVVREYINCHKFRDEYADMAKSICPAITPGQAKKAVALLVELKLIEKGDDGYYHLTNAIVSTGSQINNLGAHEYHKSMLEIGKAAIDTFTLDKRYVRSITGSFSQETYDAIKDVMDEARKKVLALIESDKGKQKVYQIGMQLFPLEVSDKK